VSLEPPEHEDSPDAAPNPPTAPPPRIIPDSPPERRRTSSRTRLTAMIVACALFMQNLDSTVIATALPTMARAFGADPLHMNVALTSYLLSLAVFIPASGWMADRYGTRTVFRAAIAIFTVGSILCGRANGLGFLVGARVLQGVGGAMMVPVGRLVLLRSVAKSELVAAMSWLTVPALVGPVVGPPLGGFIVTYFSWRWIFDINVPIGVLGMVLVTLFVEEVREPDTGRFDVIGLVLSAIALSGLLFGFETVGRGLVAPWITGAMVAVGLLAAGAYALHARRHPRPLIDLSLMRIPTFGLTIYAALLFRIGTGAIPYLLPLMLQIGFGLSAAQSGLITFASAAGALVMKPITQWALRLFGFRDTLFWNGIIAGLFLAACAGFRPSWPTAALYVILLFGGFFRSLQFTGYNAIAYADIPRQRMSAATSLYSTQQQLAQTLGISVGAASLWIATLAAGHTMPSLAEYSEAFLVVAFISLIASPLVLLLPREAGAEMSGKRYGTTQPAATTTAEPQIAVASAVRGTGSGMPR
jgi:EmrB/QacA subfamily drug resistance transporter